MAVETRPQKRAISKRDHALLTKLVTPQDGSSDYDEKGNRTMESFDTSIFQQISANTSGVIQDIESMYQLLPDIELSTQILVSSILSPKDLTTPKLTIKSESEKCKKETLTAMTDHLQTYFTTTYKIDKELSHVLTEALVTKGSYIRMIVPESGVDKIINERGPMTLESMRDQLNNDGTYRLGSLGLLADDPTALKKNDDDPDNTSINIATMLDDSSYHRSSYAGIGDYIKVVDDPDAVKIPALVNAVSEHRKRTALKRAGKLTMLSVSERRKKERIAREKVNAGDKLAPPADKKEGKKSDKELMEGLEEARIYERQDIVNIPTKHDVSDRKMVGHPMVVDLPPGAVIPTHIPGKPKEHLDYFVLLDHLGYPINIDGAMDHYNLLKNSWNESKSETTISKVVNEMRNNFGGGSGAMTNDPIKSMEQATRLFADVVERSLLKRYRTGTGNTSAMIARPSQLYQIMLARTLQKKETQVLYVPGELMSYIKFYNNDHGIGKSILENSRILGGIRVLMMFSNAIANVRNNTARTELGITFDPNDPTPLKTAAKIKNAYMRSRSNNFPLGEGSPDAALSYINQAGVDVVYGGHQDLPEMKVETRDKSGNMRTVDSALEEDYRSRHIMAFGLSPEVVDASKRVDFATTIVNSSLMLTKRVLIYQEHYQIQKADYIRKYTNNSETLLDALFDIAEKDETTDAESIVEDFLRNLTTELPNPDTVTLKAQMEAYEEYSRAVDRVIDAEISDDFGIHDVDGEIVNRLREIKAAYKAVFMRQFIRDNNILPEIATMLDKNDEGKFIQDFEETHGAHMEALKEQVDAYVKKAMDSEAKREAKLRVEEEKRNTKYSDKSEGEDEVGDDTDIDTDDVSDDAGDDDEDGDIKEGSGFTFDLDDTDGDGVVSEEEETDAIEDADGEGSDVPDLDGEEGTDNTEGVEDVPELDLGDGDEDVDQDVVDIPQEDIDETPGSGDEVEESTDAVTNIDSNSEDSEEETGKESSGEVDNIDTEKEDNEGDNEVEDNASEGDLPELKLDDEEDDEDKDKEDK